MPIKNIIPYAHDLLRACLYEGAAALDGTAGNGYDTLVLAQAVGRSGKVWAFDVQQAALVQTHKRLQEAGMRQQVSLICDSHAGLSAYVSEPLDAAVFNFGWLPGGSKNITTRAAGSIAALNQALNLLKVHAVLAAVLYPGHDEGNREAQAVEEWAQNLPQQEFAVLKYGFANRKNRPPYLLAIEKLR